MLIFNGNLARVWHAVGVNDTATAAAPHVFRDLHVAPTAFFVVRPA